MGNTIKKMMIRTINWKHNQKEKMMIRTINGKYNEIGLRKYSGQLYSKLM